MSEVKEICAIIAELTAQKESKISILDQKIACFCRPSSTRFTRTRDRLIKERDELRESMRHGFGVFSPLRRLPVETLCAIFWLTVPFAEVLEFASEHEMNIYHHPPWTLEQVCHHWRDVAVSLSSLWTTVVLDKNTHPTALSKQLQRSGKRPLHICINFRICPSILELEALVHCSPRWKHINLSLGMTRWDTACMECLEVAQNKLPLLQQLRFSHFLSDQITTTFRVAPLLSDVQLDADSRKFELPWGQITRYASKNEWRSHLHALSLAKNVVECQLEMNIIGSRLPLQPPLQLSSLRVLHVWTGHLSDGYFPYSLVLPALEDLGMDSFTADTHAWLQRSSCQLKKLSLYWRLTTQYLFLDKLPDLVELRIKLEGKEEMEQYLAERLAADAGDKPVLPKLERILRRDDSVPLARGTWLQSSANGPPARARAQPPVVLRFAGLVEGGARGHTVRYACLLSIYYAPI
ncbi:hypothetical protein B0H10DRAFT_1956822 [Mycena sp. CBHHK59/15]|nr:hypothetical protein B0H10DRAFT_1956822 [Mycena sp. CBHHK59/15]